MSRIRSVHPGLFTDESYMALGHAAARLLIGLWTECDDHGLFEWKPLTLKARILPVHAEDIDLLLQELETNDLITHYEMCDKHYGAVRNFVKYQRPQKPRYYFPLPSWLESYVGLELTFAEFQKKFGSDDGKPCSAEAVEGTVAVPDEDEKSQTNEGGEKEIGGHPLTPASASRPARRGVSAGKLPPEHDAAFDQFWTTFPLRRRGNRDRAKAAYARALARRTAEEIQRGVAAYTQSGEVARGFATGALRWLDDDRWTDQPGEIRQANGVHAGASDSGKTMGQRKKELGL